MINLVSRWLDRLRELSWHRKLAKIARKAKPPPKPPTDPELSSQASSEWSQSTGSETGEAKSLESSTCQNSRYIRRRIVNSSAAKKHEPWNDKFDIMLGTLANIKKHVSCRTCQQIVGSLSLTFQPGSCMPPPEPSSSFQISIVRSQPN